MKLGGINRKLIRISASGVLGVAIVMILAGILVPWGSLDVSTKIGPIPVTLEAEVYEYGVKYEANLSGASAIAGGGQVPDKIADERIFITGLGDFQETIGFVKGSSKDKVIYTTLYTWPPPENGTAQIKITTTVGSIPWWPVGVAQDVSITIEILSAHNLTEVKVNKVRFEIHREIGGQDKYKVAWEFSPGDNLKKVGDKVTYSGKIKADEDYGEFTVLGDAELEMKDKFGHSNKRGDGTYLELKPPPKRIKLWSMDQGQTVRIALMLAAFPVSVVAMVLLAVSAFAGYKKKRWAWKVAVAGAVIAILAVLFYISGVSALIDLTGYGEWFSWSPLFAIPVLGAVLSIPGAVMLFMVKPVARKRAARRPRKKRPKVRAGKEIAARRPPRKKTTKKSKKRKGKKK